MASPSRVIVTLGANVEQLVAGMNQAIEAIRSTGSQVTGELKNISAVSAATSSSIAEALGSMGISVSGLLGPLASLFTAYKAFSEIRAFVDLGLKTNEYLQTSQLGIASIIQSQAVLKDSGDHTLSGVEALDAAMALAGNQVQKLRVAGIQTIATTQELVLAYKAALSPGLGAGMNLDQIRDITVKAAQAAGAMGIEMKDMPHHMTAIVGGMRTMQSLLARNLGLNAEIIRGWRESGHLYEHLNALLTPFAAAGDRILRSWAGVTSSLKETEEVMSAMMTKPLFEKLQAGMFEALNSLFNIGSGTINESMLGIVRFGQAISSALGDVAVRAMNGIIDGLKSISAWFTEHREKIVAFGAALTNVFFAISGAAGNFLHALVAVGTALLGPLTIGLNVLAALLSSSVVQFALLAYMLRGPIVGGFEFLVKGVRDAVQFVHLFQYAMVAVNDLGLTAGVNSIAFAFNDAKTQAIKLGSSITGLLNPWVALGIAVVGAAFALERYLTRQERAAATAKQLANDVATQGSQFRDIAKQLVENEKVENDQHITIAEYANAMERRKALIAELNAIYPGFNDYLIDEEGHERDIATAIKMANDERIKKIKLQIAETEANLKQAKAAKESREGMVGSLFGAGASMGGPVGFITQGAGALLYKKGVESADRAAKGYEDTLVTLNHELAESLTVEKDLAEATGKKGVGTEKDRTAKQVAAWKEELEELKRTKIDEAAAEHRFYEWSVADEIEFWKDKLAHTKDGTAAHRAVLGQLNRLEMGEMKDAHDAEIADLKTQAQEMKGEGDKRIAVLRTILEKELEVHKEAGGRKSKEVIAAEHAITMGEREEEQFRIQGLRAEADKYQSGSAEKIAILRRVLEQEIALGQREGRSAEATSKEIIAARKALNDELRKQEEEQRRISERDIKGSEASALREIEAEQQHWDALKSAGYIGEREYLLGLQAFEDERYEKAKTALLLLAIVWRDDAEKYAQYLRDLRILEDEHKKRTGSITDKGLPESPIKGMQDSIEGYDKRGGLLGSIVGNINSGIDPMVDKWMQGVQAMWNHTLKFSQAVKGIFVSIRDLIIQAALKSAAEWIAQQIRVLLVNLFVSRTTAAAHRQAAAQKSAATVTQAGTENVANASVAATATAATEAKNNWIYALVAAGIMLAAVLAMGRFSAEGGFDVGSFSPLTQLHPREMVLPANLAERVRGMTEDGGGGGGGHTFNFHVHAIDAGGVRDFFRRYKGEVVDTVVAAHRENRFDGRRRKS